MDLHERTIDSCAWNLNSMSLMEAYWSECRSYWTLFVRLVLHDIDPFRIHIFNLLTPNVNYSGRTAPLTSKVAFYIFIQQI